MEGKLFLRCMSHRTTAATTLGCLSTGLVLCYLIDNYLDNYFIMIPKVLVEEAISVGVEKSYLDESFKKAAPEIAKQVAQELRNICTKKPESIYDQMAQRSKCKNYPAQTKTKGYSHG